jgi:hypothetical protein
MARQYAAAFRLLDACDVDTDFTAEVFAITARSLCLDRRRAER